MFLLLNTLYIEILRRLGKEEYVIFRSIALERTGTEYWGT
jgi:hypothetical protein